METTVLLPEGGEHHYADCHAAVSEGGLWIVADDEGVVESFGPGEWDSVTVTAP